ncbi:MAG TPA: hypothetical protein VK611_29470 [Acidimicrobiales bacterium]|nr:hypothetical protein [Acidimicrobiales bacterium]
MSRSRCPVVVLSLLPVLLLPLVVACGDDADDADDATPTTTTEPDTTTTTTTTTRAAEGPAEWVEVVQDVSRRIDALYNEPDPERVRDVVAEYTDYYETQVHNITELADAGVHLEDDEPTTVVAVEYQDPQPAGGFVGLTVLVKDHGDRVVDDATGDVIQERGAAVDQPCEIWLLRPDGGDGSYRIHSRSSAAACPAGAEEAA